VPTLPALHAPGQGFRGRVRVAATRYRCSYRLVDRCVAGSGWGSGGATGSGIAATGAGRLAARTAVDA
jgi:hypothetical protein